MSSDNEQVLVDRIRSACENKTPLRLHGGDTKAFYGREPVGEALDLSIHQGVVNYEPTELVLTARAGTSIAELESILAENGQMLPFEPPHFAAGATLGGAIATGLAGPKRPWSGAPRDLVLGTKILDGCGQVLNFGGQVMKNVAGYDVARLMAGAMGTLGILLEISVKVLPRPSTEQTLIIEADRENALKRMRTLAAQPAPLTGACYWNNRLYLRLSGNASGVDAWSKQVGGDGGDNRIWTKLRDHTLDFFASDRPLWRLSLAPATPALACETESLVDWAGAQRWVIGDVDMVRVREEVAKTGGHAILFRHGDRKKDIFHPLDPVRARFHANLKQTFDPHGIFNPGRMYAAW